jgi:hypothetical protein
MIMVSFVFLVLFLIIVICFHDWVCVSLIN